MISTLSAFSLLVGAAAVAGYLLPTLWPHFLSTCLLSLMGILITLKTIPEASIKFIKANLTGIDMCKKEKKQIPEAIGVIAGSSFLIVMFLMLPIPFLHFDQISNFNFFNKFQVPLPSVNLAATTFNDAQFQAMITALLSICCMILLGFVDDVFDLRWLHKLLLPTIASLPLLTVYAVTYNQTWVLLPKPWYFSVDLGLFYYLYMAMMAVFCTNAINILAGVNGLEVGQSLIIACSVTIFNLVEFSGDHWKMHVFSFTFLLPFIGVSWALFQFNKYPARVFVGDTYCYFAGMTFAVVGILGHFSKTMLLFFIPQIFNFLFSCPQLFHFVPCPRHRLPRFDPSTGLLNPSICEYEPKNLKLLGKFCLFVAKFLRISREVEISTSKAECTNFTLINLFLLWFGPMREDTLVTRLLILQALCSLVAFFIRYHLVQYIY